MSRHSAASLPATRIPSKPSEPWSLIWPERDSGATRSSARAMSVRLSQFGGHFTSVWGVDPGQAPRDADRLGANVATIDQDFNSPRHREQQLIGVDRIEVGARGETVAVGALDDKQLHGAVAFGHPRGQLAQVPGR